ncbi:phage shock protein PspA [Parageobacillus genomosp. 1]|uniref:Phage shock protein PspA n=1 Tax=Parageobacillus genomosp. 1 TaxID=1295642 RepID=A0ABC9VI55_9BACL|nr:PspA/IM30 family protein [Parageobacillus genomosp. 1]EZP78413.1 phage shock protein PspA [Parageobacillus genomosp. 1]
MGLFHRVKTIILAEMHELVDQWEDPATMTKQYLRELEEHIHQGQQALAQQLLAEQRYETLIAQTKAIVEKRSRQATLALERNEEAMAKLALREKLLYEKKLSTYEQQYETVKEKTAYMVEQLKQLQEKHEELSAKQLELIARANAANALKQIDATLASFRPDHALRGFARMEERVLALEAEAAAARHFLASKHSFPFSLEEEVENELAKWKEAQTKNV